MVDAGAKSATGAEQTATLLVSCPDQRGIVAALAQTLHGYGGNILDSDQHSDTAAKVFFQRIRFDLSDLHTDRITLERAIDEVGQRFKMNWRITYAGERKRIAIFVSRADHCLYDLLIRQRSGEFDCDVALIISNHGDLKPIADYFAVPFHVFPVTRETKDEVEAEEIAHLRREKVDLVVLARYMQILSGQFVAAFPTRIINIHHSFLPSFVGAKPYHQAHRRGVKLIGATSHYVTADLDEGPIIEQAVVRTCHRDAISDLVRKGRDLERTVLAQAVRWHLEDRVLTYQNKTVVFG